MRPPSTRRASDGAKRGFTIVEVIVSLFVLAVAAYSFGTLSISGKLWLSKSYYRSKAMELAALKVEENTAKSYKSLSSSAGAYCLEPNMQWTDLGEGSCLAASGTPYSWSVKVTEPVMNGLVPYKLMSSEVTFKENGAAQTVKLSGITPYPYIHILSSDFGRSPALGTAYSVLYSQPVNFRVKKNLVISYSAAISISDTSGIQPLHTIYTRCRVATTRGNIIAYPETRTPILTQPLINNWVQVSDIPPGEAQVVIEWRKESSAGGVYGESGNLIVLAVENL